VKTTVNRVVTAAAMVVVALGAGLVTAGAATASPGHLHYPVLRIDNALHQVQLTIPTPACPPSDAGCQWMLYVGEPLVTGKPTVAVVTGTSGRLTLPFPAFCGILQADALLGPAPWTRQAGTRKKISTCPGTAPGGSTTPGVDGGTPGGNPSALPFITAGEPQAPASAVQAADAAGAPVAQLPFTGLDVEPLAATGWGLVLAGGLLLVPVGLRRRLRARAAAVGVADWRDGVRRTGMWFFGL